MKMKLADISKKISKGSTPRGKVNYSKNEDNYFLRVTDMVDLANVYKSEFTLSNEDINKNKMKIWPINTVLVSIEGTVGKISILKKEMSFNQAVAGIIPNEEIINPRYLMYYLRTTPVFSGILKGTIMPALRLGDLSKIEIEVPDMETQNKIVSIVDSITNKIDLNNGINNNLLEQNKSLYKEWFIDFNFDYNGKKYKDSNGEMINSEIGLIPKNWTIKRIDELNLDISDGNYSSKYPTKQEFKEEGIPFIRGTDFVGYSISKKALMYITPEKHDELKKGHLKKNDILITTRGEIGRIAFISDDFIDANINAQLIRINGGEKYSRAFLGTALISEHIQNDIQSLVTGTALQQLPVGKFNQIKLIIPNDSEIIKRFDCIAEANLEVIQSNEKVNELLEQLRDTLLPKLMNGEIGLDNIEI